MTNKKLLENLINCIIKQLPFDKFTIYHLEGYDGNTYQNVCFVSKNKVVQPIPVSLEKKLKEILKWIHKEYSEVLVAFYVDNLYICGDRVPENPFIVPKTDKWLPWDDTAGTKWIHEWDDGTTDKGWITDNATTDKTWYVSDNYALLKNYKQGEWTSITMSAEVGKPMKVIKEK